MTSSLKRECAHHNAAAHPAQRGDYSSAQKKPPPGATVQADGTDNLATQSEAHSPVQPRAPPSRMLRFPEVIARTGISRTTIWRRIKAGTFPAPVQLGLNSIGWPEPAIIEWVESRPVVAYATEAA